MSAHLVARPASPRKRVLLVEDNALNLKLAREILRLAGYEVIGARTGEECLALARSEPFDVILMDIQLPEMDGITATRLLKATPPLSRVPVVAVSALAHREDRDRAIGVGCVGWVSKPYSMKGLVAAVERAIGRD